MSNNPDRPASRAASKTAAKKSTKNAKEASKPLPEAKGQVLSLAELKAKVEKKRVVNLRLGGAIEAGELSGGEVVSIEYRLLRPDETAMILDRTSTILPPHKENPPEGEFNPETHLDFTNAGYIKKKRDAENEARAMALYWCVTMFTEDNPGLSDVDDIVQYIQSQLEDSMLEQLYLAVQEQPFTEIALANFS